MPFGCSCPSVSPILLLGIKEWKLQGKRHSIPNLFQDASHYHIKIISCSLIQWSFFFVFKMTLEPPAWTTQSELVAIFWQNLIPLQWIYFQKGRLFVMWNIFFLPQLCWNNLLSAVTDVRRTNRKLLHDETTSVSVSITSKFWFESFFATQRMLIYS